MESSGNGLQFLNRLGSRCGSVVHVQIRSRNQVGTLILYASLSEHQLSLWTPLDTPGCLACHCLVPCCASRGSRVMPLRVMTLLTSMSSQLARSPPPHPCWSSSFHSQAINPGNVRNTPEPRGLTLSCDPELATTGYIIHPTILLASECLNSSTSPSCTGFAAVLSSTRLGTGYVQSFILILLRRLSPACYPRPNSPPYTRYDQYNIEAFIKHDQL